MHSPLLVAIAKYLPVNAATLAPATAGFGLPTVIFSAVVICLLG